jgi:hypothetical protein
MDEWGVDPKCRAGTVPRGARTLYLRHLWDVLEQALRKAAARTLAADQEPIYLIDREALIFAVVVSKTLQNNPEIC